MVDPFGPVSLMITAFVAVNWIYNNCLDPANSAERKYREFASAIRGLVRAIGQIEDNFGINWRSSDGNPDNDARAIKQDFALILEDCEQLLKNNARFRYGSANMLQNVVWGASTQPRINDLLGRIAFQMQRATFIYSTLSYNRLSEMAPQLSYVARSLNPTALPTRTVDQYLIPSEIVSRFLDAAQRKPPQGFVSLREFPIQIGLTTLVEHLEQSTVRSDPYEPQTLHQYISLLKAQWLMQLIKGLISFQNLGYWERSEIEDLESKIVRELMRNDLTIYHLGEVLNQPFGHFLIWQTSPRNVMRNRMQAFENEQEIMNVELPVPPGFQNCKLVVFRDTAHRRGSKVRLVRQLKQNGQLLPPDSHTIDSFTDVFKPLYAVSFARDQQLSIAICNAEGGEEELYEFDELKNVFKLQWALTNYNVFSDFGDVDWAIARSWKSSTGGKRSRIQIWWFDPDDNLERVAAEMMTPRSQNSGKDSILSRMTSASGKAILQDSKSQRPLSHASYGTSDSELEVIEAVPPYEPLLIIYAVRDRHLEYLGLPLHGQMFIEQASCDCKKHADRCIRAVIRSGNGVESHIKRVTASRSSPHDIPNLNTFARSWLKGAPQHPSMKGAESLVFRDLVLDFVDQKSRHRFNQQFEFIVRLQRSREETQGLLLKRAKYLSNKPRGEGNPKTRLTGIVEDKEALECASPSSGSVSTIPTELGDTSRPTSMAIRRDSGVGSRSSEIYELPGR